MIMKKVILIRSRATDAAVYKIANSLSENGYDVHLLIWDRQHNLKNENNKKYTINKFNLKAPYDKLTIYFYHPFWWIYEFYFLMVNKWDIVHACDLDTLYPAIIVKIIKGVKLYYIIYDFYSNHISDGGNIFIKFIKSFFSHIEKFGIGFTNILFLVDEIRLKEVEGARIKKAVILYNSPPDILDLKRLPSGNSEKFTIFYAGVLQKIRGVDYMVKAVEGLDNVELIIAGMEDLSHLSISINVNIKNKVRYIGWIPTYEEVLIKSMSSDVLFRFIDPETSQCIYGSPNKLYEAMMCGKPIIINSEMGASKIVLDEDCGLTVPYGDIEALKVALVRLRDDPELKNRLGENGRRAFKNKYSWEIMEKRLLDAYKI